jgi:hypothetical protein
MPPLLRKKLPEFLPPLAIFIARFSPCFAIDIWDQRRKEWLPLRASNRGLRGYNLISLALKIPKLDCATWALAFQRKL